ncbi:hypothetical protein RHS03_09475, partial [Rhizoctonia solani]
MDAPSTPNRPRQTPNHGPPTRPSTRSRRVTRSVAALQNNHPSPAPSSSLSPPPETEQTQEQEQGGATDETVPADDNISHIQTVAAVSPLDPQAPTASTTTPTSKKRRSPAEDDDDPTDGPLLSEYMCPICLSPPPSAIVTLYVHPVPSSSPHLSN